MPNTASFLRRPDFLKPRVAAGQVVEPLLQPFAPDEWDARSADSDDADLSELNSAMRALVDIFPDVEPEVFREMLVNLSEQSRLEVVTEHMLRDGARYAQGRHRKATKQEPASTRTSIDTQERPPLAKEDCFRSEGYKRAVKDAFYQEFRNLSHSSIRAVLAEHNYSYTRARPTLQQLASRSWRVSLSNLWSRKRNAATDAHEHPLIEWQPDLTGSGVMLPCLKRTKSGELNRELYDTLVAPILIQQKEEQHQHDLLLATELNEAEAEEAQAMYDCECCYGSVTFEQVSTCDDACHYICFQCIRFATNEALYGQGWARNIDHEKTSLRCLAPSVDECHGCIPSDLLRRALSADKDGQLTWQKLEQRVASECLLKSQLPLLRCPFCPYAELDELPDLRFRDPMTVATHLACDLYVVEDEEGVIKRAAEDAEKAWLANEGKQALEKISVNVRLDQFGSVKQEVIAGIEPGKGWNANTLMDALMDAIMI
ncbi:hypothetical protein MBLNU459_g1691t2 [Dothideomycetes sp. NU459]